MLYKVSLKVKTDITKIVVRRNNKYMTSRNEGDTLGNNIANISLSLASAKSTNNKTVLRVINSINYSPL